MTGRRGMISKELTDVGCSRMQLLTRVWLLKDVG